jgi:predicted MFS family arabinose efflux permease
MLLPSIPKSTRQGGATVRQALVQPGVVAVATAWPLLLLAHFAVFSYIAPFIRATGLPDSATGISLAVFGAAGLIGIWIAGCTADSYPRRALLVTVTVFVSTFAVMPFLANTWGGNLLLMGLWGTAFGAIGIYNQAAILRAGGKHRDAANGLTVVALQLGIAVGAGFGALALSFAGALLVPLVAAVPAAAALAIAIGNRHHGYPPGPHEGKQHT